MSVFGTYGIVDRPSDHQSVWNIPLFGCMDRRSHYSGHKIILGEFEIYQLEISLIVLMLYDIN